MELARAAKDDLIYKFMDNKRYEKACQVLDEGFEDAFNILSLQKDTRDSRVQMSLNA